MQVAVHFQNVSRIFNNEVRAVDGVTFDIYDGEFFTMLGPSGSRRSGPDSGSDRKSVV